MFIKPDNHRPRAYCEADKPVYNYPGLSHVEDGTGNMKIWFKVTSAPGERKYATCTVACNNGNYVPA